MIRRLPVGAELQAGGTHFRVWAPLRGKVEAVFENPQPGGTAGLELTPEEGGYFSGFSADAGEGTLYMFRLDSGGRLYPDPASRFQPRGPHGPSQVIDPRKFTWTDRDWQGVTMPGQVIYEMHIGTFTAEGTWPAAAEQLPELASLGVSLIEVMPVAEFPGRFGWGYDGVDLFAPTRLYGMPDDFRRFVDTAHKCSIGVVLDVVYNHLGPDGNFLKEFSPDYFTDRYLCEWGDAVNFDGETSGPVREFFLANAAYWINEFHIDGLRIDATQQIFDASGKHILRELTEKARTAAGSRSIVIISENEPQQTHLVRPPEEGGFGMDALWNDDFHHSSIVALTGRREAYYYDYLGSPQEFISSMKWGYLYQGQYYMWQKNARGTPSFGLKPESFVNFIQNHDQIANSGQGLRIHFLTSPALFRVFSALLILGTGTPMLFQGQEFASSSPFNYFADHNPELMKLVKKGRLDFLTQFRSTFTMKHMIADPSDTGVFTRSKLDFSERQKNREIYEMYRDLLRIRATDHVFRALRQNRVDGAVLGHSAFLIRYFSEGGRDRLLVINTGGDLDLDPAPEPLLAPSPGASWALIWSSDNPRYGGGGLCDLDTGLDWKIPAWSATFLGSERHQ